MIGDTSIQQTLAFIRHRYAYSPELAIILGSGLGHLRGEVRNAFSIPYAELPLFPAQQVAGHLAEIVFGDLFGRKVVLFCGRLHVYQGLSAFASTLTVRLAAALGCDSILLTCAVGGIASGIKPGDFLLVNDHLNFSGLNPLQGLNPPVFIDLHACYQHEFFPRLKLTAESLNCSIHSGVLAYMPGPSYETPAEIRALGAMGASAVSMSTVPEAIMARALALKVTALALVTNFAGGRADETLSHQEVLSCSAAAAEPFGSLVKTLLPLI